VTAVPIPDPPDLDAIAARTRRLAPADNWGKVCWIADARTDIDALVEYARAAAGRVSELTRERDECEAVRAELAQVVWLKEQRDKARSDVDYWRKVADDHSLVCDERLARIRAVEAVLDAIPADVMEPQSRTEILVRGQHLLARDLRRLALVGPVEPQEDA